MRGKNFILMLFFVGVFGVFSVSIQAQQNPGDVWLVVPQGVQPGDRFHVELHMNTGFERLAAYTVNLKFDADLIAVDTFVGKSGKEVVLPHGFVSLNSADTAEKILCTGYTSNPTGPGTDLHILNIHFIARSSGLSQIIVNVTMLLNAEADTIGTPQGINAGVAIGSTGISGDVNIDGVIDVVDALLLARYSGIISRPVIIDTSVADFNKDNTINILDALLITRHLMRLDIIKSE